MNIDLSKILVVNFAVDERTIEFSNYCFSNLGFSNILVINGESGFREKFLILSDIAKDNNEFDCFLRNDSDRFVFSGIYELIELFYAKNAKVAEGYCFDYLMNKFRGSTPHLFDRDTLLWLNDNNDLMPDCLKPESRFVEKVQDKFGKVYRTDILTNLHDYEQYPSKICNTFITRLGRNHAHLYSKDHLKKINKYDLMKLASNYIKSNKKTNMDYLDYGYLDENVDPIDVNDFPHLYEKYNGLYQELKRN